MTQEEIRLAESDARQKHWKRWGPYLSERAWGTVREDYSPHGTAWEFLPHDHARSRAYRWNEDGIAGICDRHQTICFALALVERARSHPERTPLRAHRQRGQPRRGREGILLLPRQHAHAFLHEVSLQVSAGANSPTRTWWRRTGAAAEDQPEFELMDTGVFNEDRYFDVFVEYAKADRRRHPDPHHGRQPRPGNGHACTCCPPSGSATPGRGATGAAEPRLQAGAACRPALQSSWTTLTTGRRWLYCEGSPGIAVHRKRNQRPAPVRSRQPHALRQGRHQRLRRPRTRTTP